MIGNHSSSTCSNLSVSLGSLATVLLVQPRFIFPFNGINVKKHSNVSWWISAIGGLAPWCLPDLDQVTDIAFGARSDVVCTVSDTGEAGSLTPQVWQVVNMREGKQQVMPQWTWTNVDMARWLEAERKAHVHYWPQLLAITKISTIRH